MTRLYILNPPNWTCQFLNHLRKDVKHNNVRVYTSTDLPSIQPNYCLLPKFFVFVFIQRQTILTAIFLLKKVGRTIASFLGIYGRRISRMVFNRLLNNTVFYVLVLASQKFKFDSSITAISISG